MWGSLLAAALVTADPATHSVTMSVVSTDCGKDAQIEFLLVGPDSDHDYEALFLTEASVADIAAAFDKAGIPKGIPVDARTCRFWSVGNRLEMTPAFTNLVRQTTEDALPPIVFTGGTRIAAESGVREGAHTTEIPEANTNSPCAVFALYNCAQSLIQLDDSLEQSPTYGRFQPAVKIPKGEKRTITFTWKGTKDVEPLTLKLEPGKLAEVVTTLKARSVRALANTPSSPSELDVTTDFSPSLTIREANDYAQVLAMLDSPRVKMNGFKEGQLYYRAFLPQEKWRDRKERLCQPPEVHLHADGTVLVNEILEDWSGDDDTLGPKLSEKAHPCADIAAAAKLAGPLSERTMTVLVFAPAETKLATIYALKKGMPKPPLNWYVFTE